MSGQTQLREALRLVNLAADASHALAYESGPSDALTAWEAERYGRLCVVRDALALVILHDQGDYSR